MVNTSNQGLYSPNKIHLHRLCNNMKNYKWENKIYNTYVLCYKRKLEKTPNVIHSTNYVSGYVLKHTYTQTKNTGVTFIRCVKHQTKTYQVLVYSHFVIPMFLISKIYIPAERNILQT